MKATLLEMVFPTDTNPHGTLFGGQLVAWMDKAAGVAAMRRARGPVVTVAIDSIDFKVPVRVGELVELTAEVISIGRTSMRVRVEAIRERPVEGTRESCNVGHFTLVAIDAEHRPTPVPPEMPDA